MGKIQEMQMEGEDDGFEVNKVQEEETPKIEKRNVTKKNNQSKSGPQEKTTKWCEYSERNIKETKRKNLLRYKKITGLTEGKTESAKQLKEISRTKKKSLNLNAYVMVVTDKPEKQSNQENGKIKILNTNEKRNVFTMRIFKNMKLDTEKLDSVLKWKRLFSKIGKSGNIKMKKQANNLIYDYKHKSLFLKKYSKGRQINRSKEQKLKWGWQAEILEQLKHRGIEKTVAGNKAELAKKPPVNLA